MEAEIIAIKKELNDLQESLKKYEGLLDKAINDKDVELQKTYINLLAQIIALLTEGKRQLAVRVRRTRTATTRAATTTTTTSPGTNRRNFVNSEPSEYELEAMDNPKMARTCSNGLRCLFGNKKEKFSHTL